MSPSVKENDTTVDVLPTIANVQEVAEFLRVNRKTVYEAVSKNEIPHRRIGKSIRFARQAIQKWLAGEEEHLRSGRVAA